MRQAAQVVTAFHSVVQVPLSSISRPCNELSSSPIPLQSTSLFLPYPRSCNNITSILNLDVLPIASALNYCNGQNSESKLTSILVKRAFESNTIMQHDNRATSIMAHRHTLEVPVLLPRRHLRGWGFWLLLLLARGPRRRFLGGGRWKVGRSLNTGHG
jgi:hypothetical protein